MKTKFYQFMKGCLAMAAAAALLIASASTADAQGPGDEAWSIPVLGLAQDHEGCAAWNADGTGPEPYGAGHPVPLPGFSPYPYYGASRDYDDIDPDPGAGLCHIEGDITGFPLFVQALADHNIQPGQISFKMGLCDLGEDQEGTDWFVIGLSSHAFYYDATFALLVDGEPAVAWTSVFTDNYSFTTWAYFMINCSFGLPDSIWQQGSPEAVKEVGRALLEDIDGQELRMIAQIDFSGESFAGNGRIGWFWDVTTGQIEKGLPQLPFQGMAADHQGMAGWNADGSGPEPYGDGHGAQRYYVASRDYDDIDPDPDAAFGHFLPEMTGFMNFALQMEYRDYTPDQLLLKNGLSSLGADVMGEDWGFENGTDYWCNYYDIDYVLELDGEQIITGLVDTSLSWMSPDPLFWWCEATLDRPRDGSAFASGDAQIVANAFLKDLESRKLVYDIQQLTYDADTFNSNGRYNGGYFNVVEARMVGKHDEACCFVQTDTLGSGFSSETHWTMAHSPYFIDNSLYIPEGHTLYVEPGVKVALRGPYNIDVKGNIIAEGTADQGILFTHSNPLQEWNSLTYDGPLTAPASIFEYCTFEYSHSIKASPINSGGVIAIGFFDDLTFNRCIFRHNTVDVPGELPPSGGAIALWDASPVIDYCTFYNNNAVMGGAILCYQNSNPVIQYSLFHDNHASMDAGAIEIYEDCHPQLVNNTITGNTAGGFGGGIDLFENDADSIIFINNIIYGNICATGNSGQQVSLTSEYNIASFIYNDIEGGIEGFGPANHENIFYGSSNIKADPLFCFPEDMIYTLLFGSPCAGTGQWGLNMGAFDPDCWPSVPETPAEGDNFAIYPNPSCSGAPVYLAFNLESTGPVRMEIYNITGEKVAEPIGGTYAAGDHRVTFTTANLPAGLYIARLTVNGDCYVARFVVTK